MMKMVILAPRRHEMTHEEFRRYLIEVHGPLVRSVSEVATAVRHYHYNFPIEGACDDAFDHPLAVHLDVVTQGWFDSRAAQLRNMTVPQYLSTIRPDEVRFANLRRTVTYYTHEIEVTAGHRAPTRVFYFRRRRPALLRCDRRVLCA